MGLSYVVADAFTGKPLWGLPAVGERFNKPLRDAGQFTCTLDVPNTDIGDQIKARLIPDATAIYALWNGKPIWGGPFTDFTSWDPVAKQLGIQASEWRSWFTTREITPDPATNLARDATFTWKATEQLAIGAALVNYATSAPDSPPIGTQYTPSGVVRDQSYDSTSFMAVSAAIDEIAHRQNGFDWMVDYTRDPNTGYFTPFVVFWYPERIASGAAMGMLNFVSGQGGNVLTYNPPISAANRVSRMWAAGQGTPPDQLFTNASIPGLGSNVATARLDVKRLYRESKNLYDTVSTQTTLASHANSDLMALSPLLNIISVDARLDKPDMGSWYVGDRFRLRLKDEFVNLDKPAVRCLEWTVQGVADNDDARVTLALDTTDAFGPIAEVE